MIFRLHRQRYKGMGDPGANYLLRLILGIEKQPHGLRIGLLGVVFILRLVQVQVWGNSLLLFEPRHGLLLS